VACPPPSSFAAPAAWSWAQATVARLREEAIQRLGCKPTEVFQVVPGPLTDQQVVRKRLESSSGLDFAMSLTRLVTGTASAAPRLPLPPPEPGMQVRCARPGDVSRLVDMPLRLRGTTTELYDSDQLDEAPILICENLKAGCRGGSLRCGEVLAAPFRTRRARPRERLEGAPVEKS
jgi:hypothetical protein